MSQEQESCATARAGSGPLGVVAAVCVTATLIVVLLPLTVVGGDFAFWPWLDLPLLSLALGIVMIACTVAAAVDCWLSLRGTRRRSSRSYLRGAFILLLVACLASGPLVGWWLVPGLVLTWAARQRAQNTPRAALT